MANHPSQSTVDIDAESQKLRRHFKFTMDDLEKNRSGVLSKKQLERIAYYERGGKTVVILIGFLLLVFPVGFANTVVSGISNMYWNQFFFESNVWTWGLTIAIQVIFGLFLLVIGAAGVFLIVSQFLKIKPYKLVSVRGRARLEEGHSRRFTHIYYDLYINEQEFDGDSALNKVIIQGSEYMVYYLESNAEIMSIELISNADSYSL
jgi:hypothetical protein